MRRAAQVFHVNLHYKEDNPLSTGLLATMRKAYIQAQSSIEAGDYSENGAALILTSTHDAIFSTVCSPPVQRGHTFDGTY